MEKKWRDIDWETCPSCGAELEVLTTCHQTKNGVQYVYDGDEVRCPDKCEATGLHCTVEEDGRAWIDGDW